MFEVRVLGGQLDLITSDWRAGKAPVVGRRSSKPEAAGSIPATRSTQGQHGQHGRQARPGAFIASVAKRQPRPDQTRVAERPCGFESLPEHQHVRMGEWRSDGPQSRSRRFESGLELKGGAPAAPRHRIAP